MLTRIRKAMEEKEEGFTLIELLVVVIIIGILAAIAIPVFLSQRAKARDAAAKADVRNTATAEEAYLTSSSDPGTYTTDATALGNNGMKPSSGVTLHAAYAGGQGYCLVAGNVNGSGGNGTTPGTWFTYNSFAGGLQAGTATSETSAMSACQSAALTAFQKSAGASATLTWSSDASVY